METAMMTIMFGSLELNCSTSYHIREESTVSSDFSCSFITQLE